MKSAEFSCLTRCYVFNGLKRMWLLQLREHLDSAEASIESLNAQVFALGSTDTIERMREQHENIIASLQQEQLRERNELNTAVSNLKNQLDLQVSFYLLS